MRDRPLHAHFSVRRKRTPSTDRPTRDNVSDSHEEEARRQSSRSALAEARTNRRDCVHVDRAFGRHCNYRDSGQPPFARAVKGQGSGLFSALQEQRAQLGLGLKMYVDDHRLYPRYADFVISTVGSGTRWVYWPDQLQPYVVSGWSNSLYRCPSYKGLTAKALPTSDSGYPLLGTTATTPRQLTPWTPESPAPITPWRTRRWWPLPT